MFKFVKKIVVIAIVGCVVFGGFYGFKEMFPKQNPPSQVQSSEKLPDIQNLNFDPTTRKFSWDEVAKADGYQYEFTLTLGENIENYAPKAITETTYIIPENIELAGKTILFKVYAETTDGRYEHSNWAECTYTFPNDYV